MFAGLSGFELKKNDPDFEIATFVRENFLEPEKGLNQFLSDRNSSLKDHIERLWNVLLRSPEDQQSGSSLISLPHSYIVPGGRFREVYYWDSYFTMLGLVVSKRNDIIESMIENFAYLIKTFGYIPNGNRTYFLGRSQPPFFSCMITLLAATKGKQIFARYLEPMLKEYDFWMNGCEYLQENYTGINRVVLLPDGKFLNRYWDDNDTPRPESYLEDIELSDSVSSPQKLFRNLRAACESGWDFSSRWLSNSCGLASIHTTEIIPVDLNCLLFHLEKTISETFLLTGDGAMANKFLRLAKARKNAIDQYCWNPTTGFYFDYDFVAGAQRNCLTLAAAFPLFFGIASSNQANAVAEILKTKFLNPGGFVTTTDTSGQQWDAPNGWAPLQWIAIKGLLDYGHNGPAMEGAQRWMVTNEKVFRATGKIMEKYNVMDINVTAGGGEYPAQDGFGWSNGVYLKLFELFGNPDRD